MPVSRRNQIIIDEAAAADQALADLVANSETPPGDTPPVVDPAAQLTLVPSSPAPPAPPAPAPSVTPLDADAAARVLHQMDTLQGQFSATRAENAALMARVDMMTKLLSQRPAAPQAPAPPAPSIITDADREEYGDTLEVMARAAQATIMPALNSLVGRIERLEQAQRTTTVKVETAAKTSEALAEEKFENALTALCPDWVEINDDPKVLDWLAKPDIFSGSTKHDLLRQAYAVRSAERIAAIFNAYKSESGAPPSPAPAPAAEARPSPPTPPTPPAPAARNVDVNSLISPSSAAPASANLNPVGGKIWTSKDVSDLYDAKTRGKMSQQEFDTKEAQLIQAFNEGRVQD